MIGKLLLGAAIVVVSALVLTAWDFGPASLEVADLSTPTITYGPADAPAVPPYTPGYEEKPAANAYYEPGYRFSLEWEISHLFEEDGGVARVWLKNSGSNPLFVYQVGVRGDWVEEGMWYSKDTGLAVAPGERRDLGLVSFLGPDTPGEHEVEFGVALLAGTGEGAWYDYGAVLMDPVTYEFEEHAWERGVLYEGADHHTFTKLNELVDPTAPGVRETAIRVAGEYGGEYNVYQLCALFDWVRDEIGYVSDPRGAEYWAPPDETLQARGGDCEDHAILLVSMIEAIGGATRIILTEDHAFASVYIGDPEHADKVMDAVCAYYGDELSFAYWEMGGEVWLVLESTGGLYPGDLPVGAKFTENGWCFTGTEVVYFVDIVPE